MGGGTELFPETKVDPLLFVKQEVHGHHERKEMYQITHETLNGAVFDIFSAHCRFSHSDLVCKYFHKVDPVIRNGEVWGHCEPVI